MSSETSLEDSSVNNTDEHNNCTSTDSAPKKKSYFKLTLTILFLIAFVIVAGFLIYQYKQGSFKNWQTFKNYINSFGLFGPIFLTIFQCVKVLYVVIAGGIGCAAGGALFGPLVGFICNYIGIVSGSILAFCISKRFGPSFMHMLFSEKKINKYMTWMNKYKKHYTIFLWIAICSPIAPDDFLCYFTGASGMSYRRFLLIIFTAKIWSILGYSLIFGLNFH
ncbi:putative membrane protein YdjX (TVP38/TMEM64 family) [Treponema rectale]|uniref:TVP38/TMEM64 family membrane protein n=1 Tax=Treponema rectale TaxID=744512 RepID=A0A840SH01_9SPIR|nr:VTT domain-containing protein [Treponema rectale]MBB5218803.1 putative membrane protein YdjX (TVP38/TMEM64 family) [Treponema rectale]